MQPTTRTFHATQLPQHQTLSARVPTPERKGKLESNRLGDLGTTAEEGAPWTEDEVRKQRLFFNCWYREGTPLTGRSTLEVEKEAIAWAKIGLTKVGDVIDMTKETFRRRYPWLKNGYVRKSA